MNLGNVLLAGCGGTGTEVAKLLVHKKFDSITFVDFDIIETSNLNRQFLYCKNDVGKYKSKVLCDKIKIMYGKHKKSEKEIKINGLNISTGDFENRNSPGRTRIDATIALYNEHGNRTLQTPCLDSYTIDRRYKQNINADKFYYKTCKIEDLEDIAFNTIFCCLDNISSRMSLNLFRYELLVDLGVEGDKCHVKKVIKNGIAKTSCLYCIENLYNVESYTTFCTQKNIELLDNRSDVLKCLITKYNNVDTVLKEYNNLCTAKQFLPTNALEIEGIINNIIPSVSYTNAICASLAFLILKLTKYDFIFYNKHNFVKFRTAIRKNCLVCSVDAL